MVQIMHFCICNFPVWIDIAFTFKVTLFPISMIQLIVCQTYKRKLFKQLLISIYLLHPYSMMKHCLAVTWQNFQWKRRVNHQGVQPINGITAIKVIRIPLFQPPYFKRFWAIITWENHNQVFAITYSYHNVQTQ